MTRNQWVLCFAVLAAVCAVLGYSGWLGEASRIAVVMAWVEGTIAFLLYLSGPSRT